MKDLITGLSFATVGIVAYHTWLRNGTEAGDPRPSKPQTKRNLRRVTKQIGPNVFMMVPAA